MYPAALGRRLLQQIRRAGWRWWEELRKVWAWSHRLDGADWLRGGRRRSLLRPGFVNVLLLLGLVSAQVQQAGEVSCESSRVSAVNRLHAVDGNTQNGFTFEIPTCFKVSGKYLRSDPLRLCSSWDHGAALAPPPLLDFGWEGGGGGTGAFSSDFTPTASPAPLEMGCENQHAGGRAGRGLSWSLGYWAASRGPQGIRGGAGEVDWSPQFHSPGTKPQAKSFFRWTLKRSGICLIHQPMLTFCQFSCSTLISFPSNNVP